MSLIMPQIKNKQRRGEVYKQYLKEKRKVKMEEKKTRKKEEKQMGSKAPPKKKPKTLENMRVPDETMVDPTNQETVIDLEQDEMAPYFRQETTPKILITTSDRPKHKTNRFIKELKKVIPNSVVKYRRGLDLKKIIPQAISRDFTDLIIINEDAGEPSMVISHLPDGPTAEFKMMNVKLCKELKRLGAMTDHDPEINVHNFNTRLGVTVGRMLTCLFPHRPNYRGRRVVTFHNQRDFIFFRHHSHYSPDMYPATHSKVVNFHQDSESRYQFRNTEKVNLQELGPRFILKLRSLQKGTFDSKSGMYLWIHKRHEMDTSRRKFHL